MCPICRKEQLTLVSWVFGEHLGAVSGSARSAEELVLLASRFEEFAVHVVEVCRTCSWNHLVKSYVLGATRTARPPRKSRSTGRRATAPARPVNNEGQQDRSAADNPKRVRGRSRVEAVAAELGQADRPARRPADHDPAAGQGRHPEPFQGPDRRGEGCAGRPADVTDVRPARPAGDGLGRIGRQDAAASAAALRRRRLPAVPSRDRRAASRRHRAGPSDSTGSG